MVSLVATFLYVGIILLIESKAYYSELIAYYSHTITSPVETKENKHANI